jgi:hypothetical protein
MHRYQDVFFKKNIARNSTAMVKYKGLSNGSQGKTLILAKHQNHNLTNGLTMIC